MDTETFIDSYQPYRGLPALAGVCSLRDAMKPGLSVDECVARLKRVHYAMKRLHEIFVSRLTAEPVYELKMAFSLHSFICAENIAAVRKRIGEMRCRPRAARDDDRHVDRLHQRAKLVEVVTVAHAVAIHAVEDDFARSESDCFFRPGKCFAAAVTGRFGPPGELLDEKSPVSAA